MNKIKQERFKGGYELLFIVTFLFFLFFILAIWDQGLQKNVIQGIWLSLSFIGFIYLTALLTSVTITDEKILFSKVFLGLRFKTKINDIIKIDRTSAFKVKSWGSRLQVYHLDESGQEIWHVVRESMYSIKTIKALLTRLKEINPSIKLHPQYQDLIDGKIEEEDDFKKMAIK